MPNTTATKAKAVNYTADQTAAILKDYAEGMSVEAMAEKTGRTVRSLVAKLSREQVYKKKEYVSKTGAAPVSKEELVNQIANIIGTDAESLAGLEKANKTTLDKLLKFCAGV